MNVLFATDGSSEAIRAQSLIASIPWPDPTRIDVLAVGSTDHKRDELTDAVLHEAEGDSVAMGPRVGRRLDRGGLSDDLYERISGGVDLELAEVRQSLSGPGRQVTTTFLFGRPASEIVDQAGSRHEDLVVVGSRGRGPITTALLGSVSAEVVDHAPCPVLVARTAQLRRVLLAADGSDEARQAEELIGAWPFLAALPVTVASVANIFNATSMLDPLGTGAVDPNLYQEAVDGLREKHAGIAREAAARLGTHGVAATAMTIESSPVNGILDAAQKAHADLIVTGTRGRTGLARLALGSVARGVLTQSPVSVLIVRRSASTRSPH